MTPFNRAFLRNYILLQLNACYPATMTASMIYQGVKLNGLDCDESLVTREIEYLVERGFLSVKNSELSKAVKRIKISAKGIDYLESEGF